MRDSEREKLGIAGKFTLCYSGSMNQGMNDVYSFVPLMEKLKAHEDILLLLVGDGENLDEMKSETKSRNLQNIKFIPGQDLESLNKILNASDVALIPRKELLTAGSGGYPVKMFENWAVENPVILAAGKNTEERLILENANGGIAVDSGDIIAMMDTVLKMRQNENLCKEWGKCGREIVENEYSREVSSEKLARLLECL